MEAEIACYGFSSFIPVLRKMAKDQRQTGTGREACGSGRSFGEQRATADDLGEPPRRRTGTGREACCDGWRFGDQTAAADGLREQPQRQMEIGRAATEGDLASAGGERTTTDGMPVVCFFFLVAALDWAEGTFWAGVGEAASERMFDLGGRRSLLGLLSAAGHSTAEDLAPVDSTALLAVTFSSEGRLATGTAHRDLL
jgi:hypothetical protein